MHGVFVNVKVVLTSAIVVELKTNYLRVSSLEVVPEDVDIMASWNQRKTRNMFAI